MSSVKESSGWAARKHCHFCTFHTGCCHGEHMAVFDGRWSQVGPRLAARKAFAGDGLASSSICCRCWCSIVVAWLQSRLRRAATRDVWQLSSCLLPLCAMHYLSVYFWVNGTISQVIRISILCTVWHFHFWVAVYLFLRVCVRLSISWICRNFRPMHIYQLERFRLNVFV